MIIAFGVCLAPDRPEQARQLGLQGDIVEKQDREHETGGAKSIDASGIEAEVEPRHVEDRGERYVEKPGAHDDYEPDIDHGVRSASPQNDKRAEAAAPYRRD